MDIKALKALAEEVKQWSNCNQAWLDHAEDEPAAVVGHIDEDGSTYPVATIDCDQYYAAQDSIKLARFYAAANPAAILELIGRVEALEARIKELELDAARYQWLRSRHVDSGMVEIPEVKCWPEGTKAYQRISGYGAGLDAQIDKELNRRAAIAKEQQK